jgi:ParB family chromosome partitioning protein
MSIDHTDSSIASDTGRRATRISDFRETSTSCATHARAIVSISAFRCRVWALHDRLEEYLTEESCKDEIESVIAHGQLVPALGRPLRGDPEHEVEIVCGARRLFVARHLGIQLRVELREMSDREAMVAIDAENRLRKDISPYERGLSYASLLRAKYFSSQEELAHTLNVSVSQVSRLLKLAGLPSVVLSAFASPLDIRERWGLDLYTAWRDANMGPMLTQRARTLAARTPRPKAHEVYEHLLAPCGAATRRRRRCQDDVVKGGAGTPLFRIRYQRNTVALILANSAVDARLLEMIRHALSDILERKA